MATRGESMKAPAAEIQVLEPQTPPVVADPQVTPASVLVRYW